MAPDLTHLHILCKLLEHITFVDTPGILSGEKQRDQRAYDFLGVTSWFATKCDLILLLFDPHKLDISDEFRQVISSLRGHDDKIRVVLNKADQVDTQQVRLYKHRTFVISCLCGFPMLRTSNCGVIFSLINSPADEGVWSSDVVTRESFEYSWSQPGLHRV